MVNLQGMSEGFQKVSQSHFHRNNPPEMSLQTTDLQEYKENQTDRSEYTGQNDHSKLCAPSTSANIFLFLYDFCA